MPSKIHQMFWNQFPPWFQPSHIIYRHMRARLTAQPGQTRRGLRRSIGLSVLAVVVILSAVAVEHNRLSGLYIPGNWYIYNVLYGPLFIIQGITIGLALLVSRGALFHAPQQVTWEVFKVTSHGAGFIIRVQWAIVFYQLRWLLLLIMIPRLMLLGLLLVDLTGCHYCFRDLSAIAITPSVSPVFGIVLLAAFVTAALLQILVVVGFNAALGMFISVICRKQAQAQLVRLITLMIQLGLMGLALFAGKGVLDGESTALAGHSDVGRWVALLGLGAWGDQGLRFMDLHTLLRSWREVTAGIYVGLALLGIVALQAMATNALLIWVSRRASRPARA